MVFDPLESLFLELNGVTWIVRVLFTRLGPHEELLLVEYIEFDNVMYNIKKENCCTYP